MTERSRDLGRMWRRLRILALAGGACAVLAFTAGWLATRVTFGDTENARRRIQEDVRSSFAARARALRDAATPLNDPDLVTAAATGDDSALRRLFDRAAAAVGDDVSAVTVYDNSGQPIAWSGRSFDLPSDRLSGTEAWFLVQGALGLRLVHVLPVVNGTRPVGTISTEQAFDAAPVSHSDPGDFVLTSTPVPVTVELPFESGRTVPDPGRFDVAGPDGRRLFAATVAQADLTRTERRWLRRSLSAFFVLTAITLILLVGPLLGWRRPAKSASAAAGTLALCAGAVIGARALLRLASPADYSDADLFSGSAYASSLAAPLLSSPFDLLMTALTAAALVALLFTFVETVRVLRRVRRRVPSTRPRRVAFVATQLVAGGLVAALLVGYRAFVDDAIANTALDLLQFSLHPWNSARLALQVGLVVWHGVAVGAAALILRTALLPWLVESGLKTRSSIVIPWILPALAGALVLPGQLAQGASLLIMGGTAALVAGQLSQLLNRYRRGSQAYRLRLLALAVIVPALAAYPVVFSQVSQAKRSQVETRYAPQAINQRQTIQRLLQSSLTEIDALPALDDLVSTAPAVDEADASTERAFQIWRSTALSEYPLTSSVELFGSDGRLVSRFAFNLPDDLTTTPRSDDEGCDWTVYEEVSPFFAEERRVLHAGRSMCVSQPNGTTTVAGAIVVHAILDYANLPFISSRSPYVELLRPGDSFGDESLSGRDLEYAVYGWSGRPLFASKGTAWPIGPSALNQIASSRRPFWTRLSRGDEAFSIYVQNDRGGIYALGFPLLSPLGHLVNLAETTVLACVAGLIGMLIGLAIEAARGRASSGRALLREVRTSFYRKLFLAFVAASVVPVVALAVLTRNYIADQLRTSVEQEAVRTVAAARRVVEDLVVPRAASTRESIDDNLMVWVSRLIDQDVNIFRGARLQATSERNLFASGVLPTRTPADVYRALVLNRDATAIITDRIATLDYLVAATPLSARQFDGMLTVPLTLRQQDIETQIDTLNRLVLLGALLFILGGSAIGYSMAERIADPVSRLSRATHRIARGDLDARIAATSSDELGRLVGDFNRMAHDLQRQRAELERTHRLEAWAEMARQVAHEIKNPLTPIQLNAEHIRRVHADRGKPLSPVLDECVANILTQVSILRTIASEFSNFASSPTVNRVPTALAELTHGILTPYRSSLEGRVVFAVDVSPDLPPVLVDRTLLTRALTNIVENALHAMPTGGRLEVSGAVAGREVVLRVADSGAGMDADALARAFEPYFSTKVTGTGLGLPIAKRNVELSGGSVGMQSVVNRGTTVVLTLPVA